MPLPAAQTTASDDGLHQMGALVDSIAVAPDALANEATQPGTPTYADDIVASLPWTFDP
jgi:hypothetical protein